MKKLEFSADGICRIKLTEVPQPAEIEELIEDYVLSVELLPHKLRLIAVDISEMVHMIALSRRVFSEFLTQASKHYQGKVELVIAGGSLNLRRFLKLFCKSIGFRERSHIFAELSEATSWINHWQEDNDSTGKPGGMKKSGYVRKAV